MQKLDDIIKINSHSGYSTNYFSKYGLRELRIDKDVFRSDVSFLGTYLANFLFSNRKYFKNKVVLDMGCGAGILSLIVALNGAKSVVSVDISKKAIINTRKNIKVLGVKNIDVFESNLFEKINKKKFDVIIFNAPFYVKKNVLDLVSKTVANDGKLLFNFFSELPKHLNTNGVLIMPHSDIHGAKSNLINLSNKFKYNYSIIDIDNHKLGRREIILIKLRS